MQWLVHLPCVPGTQQGSFPLCSGYSGLDPPSVTQQRLQAVELLVEISQHPSVGRQDFFLCLKEQSLHVNVKINPQLTWVMPQSDC